MPSIQREHDSVIFITPDYRGKTHATKSSLIKKEILFQGEQHGKFAYIQKNAQHYEIVFSHEQGILLGESVWYYLGKPPNMILCEALQNGMETLLVVVKDSCIFMDSVVPNANVLGELAVCGATNISFDIFVYGKVSLTKTTAKKICSIKQFSILSQSVFNNIESSASFLLLPTALAIKKQVALAFPLKKIILFSIPCLLFLTTWCFFPSEKSAPVKQVSAPVNPYAGLIQALASPAPDQIIIELVQNLQLFSHLQGWRIDSLRYNAHEFYISLTSTGGTFSYLEQFAAPLTIPIEVNNKGVLATLGSSTMPRQKSQNIYFLPTVINALMDRINRILPDNNAITILNDVSYHQYASKDIMITVENASPMILLLIAEQLKNLPLVLTTISFNVSNDELISGTFLLTALGKTP